MHNRCNIDQSYKVSNLFSLVVVVVVVFFKKSIENLLPIGSNLVSKRGSFSY